jgi:hypothetical protein
MWLVALLGPTGSVKKKNKKQKTGFQTVEGVSTRTGGFNML